MKPQPPTVLRKQTFNSGFTQSEIGTWDDCAEKWYYGYNHLLRKRGTFEWYFVYGDALHNTLSNWYRGIEELAPLQIPDDVILTNEQEQELEYYTNLLEIQAERYFKYYAADRDIWRVWMNEEIVSTTFDGVTLTGKIDLGVNDGAHDIMIDHKTASQFGPNLTVGWNFRFQFMFYLWLARRVTGKRLNQFMVNGIKKPALRQNKHESMQSFLARIKADMIQRPEEYFKRLPLHTIAGSMEHFETRVLRPKIERIKLLTDTTSYGIIETLTRNQNTNNCVKFNKVCQFLPICQNGWEREGFQYVQRANKHEELEAE